MTQYLMTVHGVQGEEMPSMEEMQPMFEAVDRFNQELRSTGKWVFAGGLEPIEAATVVDNTGAEAVITDGPFSESKEYLAGFWVIEAADRDEALQLARGASAACGGPVEVRPFDALTEAENRA